MTGHVFLGVSLDGFVARLDHRLDWLTKHAATGEDHRYDAFMAGVDGIIMGSGSLRTVLTFGEIGSDIDLELTGTTAFPSGLVQVRYRVLVSGT